MAPEWNWDRDPRSANSFNHTAAFHLDQLIAASPKDTDLRFRRAIALLGSERWREAEEAFRWVLKNGRKTSNVYLALSRALAGQERISEAEQALTEAVRLGASGTEREPWQLRAGIAGVTSLLERDADNVRLWSRRARYHRLLRDWRAAADDYSQAIQLGYDGWWIRYYRGGCFVELNQLDQAQADFVAAQDTSNASRNVAHAWFAQQLMQLLKGDVDAVRARCREKANEASRKSDQEVVLWTVCLTSNVIEDYEPFLTQIEQELAEAFPEDRAKLQLIHAVLLFRAGRHDESHAELSKLPPTVDTSLFLALVQLARQETNDASKVFEQSKQLSKSRFWSDNKFPGDSTWQSRAALRILRREVESLLNHDAARVTADPVDVLCFLTRFQGIATGTRHEPSKAHSVKL